MSNERLATKRKYFSFFLFLFSLFLFFSSCSSAPARPPADVFTDRDLAVQQLNFAIHHTNRGQYETAEIFLKEARRLAVSADDPEMRVKTSISMGNLLFAMGQEERAFQEWRYAALEADASEKPVLAASARIYEIRAELLLLDERAPRNTAEDLKTRISNTMGIVSSDSNATAAAYVSLGLAEKQLGNWAEAESALRSALRIHEQNANLEEAAYAWFLIASVQSVAGNYEGAIRSLATSIQIDRRVENGYGLASSWQALGEVFQKAGRNEESRAAFRRAADIFRAIYLPDRAKELEGLF